MEEIVIWMKVPDSEVSWLLLLFETTSLIVHLHPLKTGTAKELN